jgi:hypothetical protein
MIRLPEDRGFVELVNEPDIGDRRNPVPTSIVAYYLQSDGKSPMSPAPSDVTFDIDSGGGAGARGARGPAKTVVLNAEPKAEDPSGASRFASKAGPYGLEGLRGTLSAKIEGHDISIAFAESR